MEREKLYMLAIMPPPAVRREIEEVRNAFAHTYGCKAAMKHQVHVTLYPPFKTATADEAEIEKALLQGLATLEHFVINVKGFDSFIRNEVIFLKVELSEPLKELHKEISNILAGRLQPAPRKDQPYHPHITIGYGDIPRERFTEALKDYLPRKYEARFAVEEVYLWRHNGKSWDTIATLPLKEPGGLKTQSTSLER